MSESNQNTPAQSNPACQCSSNAQKPQAQAAQAPAANNPGQDKSKKQNRKARMGR